MIDNKIGSEFVNNSLKNLLVDTSWNQLRTEMDWEVDRQVKIRWFPFHSQFKEQFCDQLKNQFEKEFGK